MKKLITSLLVLIATVIGSVGAYAYDFEVDGLYYNIISLPDLTCTLTSGDTPYTGDVVIPATVTYKNRTLSVVEIGNVFRYNHNVTSVEIPNSVTSIGAESFYDCTSLTSVVIPNSVTTIGERSFKGCTSLTSVVIPNSVTKISGETFYDCTSLASIEIPNSVTSIERNAFYDCISLASIEIPNSVTSIERYAFYDCISLASIEIPNSVTTIEGYTFNGCTSLTSVVIPNSVTTIGAGSFEDCISLASIEIPNSVTTIGERSFEGCTSLTSVVIPNSVTTIGAGSFYDCTSLASIEIPNSVTTIGGSSFYDCTSLASIEIPNSVTTIGYETFSGCTSLTSIVIPNSVTEISPLAFYRCHGLNTVRLIGGGDCEPLGWQVGFRLIGNEYGETPWIKCDNLCNLIIERELNPDECFKLYGNYISYVWPYMFNYSNSDRLSCSITNITFGCKTMPSNGISNWPLLETITFTDAVEEIEACALAGCSGLKAIYCQGMTPPQLGGSSFTTGQFLELPVYVPKGSLAAYQAAPEWCNFWDIQEYEPETGGINNVQIERSNMAADIYNLQGVCIMRAATPDDINSLAPGFYIIGGKKTLIR